MKIVGSLTTIPNRISNLDKVVRYILKQTTPLDILYLNIPYKTCDGRDYILPNNFMKNYDYYKTKIIINRCVDYGPITKIAPVIDIETNDETIIISFDDDIIIHRNVVNLLLKKHKKYKDTCLCFSGVCIGTFPYFYHIVQDNVRDIYVDWVEGVHSVLYKRSFFTTTSDLINFCKNTSINKELFYNDDHKISMYLSERGIQKLSINKDPYKYFFKINKCKTDALSYYKLPLAIAHMKIISYAKDRYYNRTYDINYSLSFYALLIMNIFTYVIRTNFNIYVKMLLLIIFIVYIKNMFILKPLRIYKSMYFL